VLVRVLAQTKTMLNSSLITVRITIHQLPLKMQTECSINNTYYLVQVDDDVKMQVKDENAKLLLKLSA